MSKTDKTSPAPSATPQPDAARRALLRGAIKGAALAPAVLTLKSGSAWAAANSIPCFNNVYGGGVTGQPLRLTVDVNGQARILKIDGRNAQQGDIVSTLCWTSGVGQPTGTFQNVTVPLI